jgi:hypothetical protein
MDGMKSRIALLYILSILFYFFVLLCCLLSAYGISMPPLTPMIWPVM